MLPLPFSEYDHNTFSQHFAKRLWYRLLQHSCGASSCKTCVKDSLVEQYRTIFENNMVRFRHAADRCICADSGKQIQSVANVPRQGLPQRWKLFATLSGREMNRHFTQMIWSSQCPCSNVCGRANRKVLDESTTLRILASLQLNGQA